MSGTSEGLLRAKNSRTAMAIPARASDAGRTRTSCGDNSHANKPARAGRCFGNDAMTRVSIQGGAVTLRMACASFRMAWYSAACARSFASSASSGSSPSR